MATEHSIVPRIALSGSPAITLAAKMSNTLRNGSAGSCAHVDYVGSEEEFLRIGLITADSLAKRPRKGKREPRLDTRGNRFHIDRWFAKRDGKPVTQLRVHYCYLDPARALELPGVREAIAAQEAQDRPARRLQLIDCGDPAVSSAAAARPGPVLRLVVDNAAGRPRASEQSAVPRLAGLSLEQQLLELVRMLSPQRQLELTKDLAMEALLGMRVPQP